MAQVQFDIPYTEQRNRGTVAIRLILAIPHMILLSLWGYVANLAAVIHWFIQVFTGRRNRGIFDFNNRYMAYAAHVNTYTGLLFDEYPGFIDDAGRTPVQYSLDYEEPVNRLTVALRIIWAIPALLFSAVLGFAGGVLTIISWFAILITDRMPRGWFDFLIKVQRYTLQTNSYVQLLTDQYPQYG